MFIVQATRFENAFVEVHPMWVLLNAQQELRVSGLVGDILDVFDM